MPHGIRVPVPEGYAFSHVPPHSAEEAVRRATALVGWQLSEEFGLQYDRRPAQWWSPVGRRGPGEMPCFEQPVVDDGEPWPRYAWLVYAEEVLVLDAARNAEVVARLPRTPERPVVARLPRTPERPTAWDRIGGEDEL